MIRKYSSPKALLSRATLAIFATTLPLFAAISGCGQDLEEQSLPAEAPNYLGKADGFSDSADYTCAIVLRSIGRVPNGTGGYMDTCQAGITSSDCRYFWEGYLDVAEEQLERFESFGVLFQTGMTQGQWYATAAERVAGVEPGFARFRFRITEFTPSPGMSYTSLNQTTIDFVPYGEWKSGGRLFDHNRVIDPMDSYHLRLENGWSISADATCPPRLEQPEYRLTYPDFNEILVGGPVEGGGKLKIVYDGRRLRSTQGCMGGHNAVSATTVMAAWMFDGGDTIRTAEVEFYRESYGYACQGQSPCVEDRVSTPIIDIPENAHLISLWFYCVPMGSSTPAGYDSDEGRNYSLPVRAKNLPWVGNFIKNISRSASDPCEGGVELGEGFSYDTWARQRAAVANVCFEIYQAGVTDWDNPDIWRQLDVKVFYSYNGEAFLDQYVSMVYRAGNNARYAIELRPLDPFAPYTCPQGPVTTVYQGSEPYVQSEFEFLLLVNGQEIRPAGPGSTFKGLFTDYANNPWREENCN
jgi:hypothetical protein